MKLNKDALTGINKRKLKMFLFFLLCSFLSWTISKLSDSYESNVKFKVVYTNLPDSLLLDPEVSPQLPAKVKASGFTYLGYAISAKPIALNLQSLKVNQGDYYLNDTEVRRQLNNALSGGITLIDVLENEHLVAAYQVDSKKIPVELDLDLNLAPNYFIQDGLKITPDSLVIKGPKQQLIKIDKAKTEPLRLQSVNQNFKREVAILPFDESFNNVEITKQVITVSGLVEKFSEKEFMVNIKPLHVPEGYQLKMFPNRVKLVCKANVKQLKELDANDFDVFVDYATKEDTEGQTLYVEMGKDPEGVYSVRLLDNKVEFILEKQ